MTVLLMSLSGLVGVLVGYVLFRPRPAKPLPFHPIANLTPPTELSLVASYGISSAEAVAGAEKGARFIREATN